MQRRFSDKAVLITGGNSGIGLASAQACAAEGARVALTGHPTATLRDAAESVRGAFAIGSGTSDLGAIDELMSEVRKRLGRLDVLFVNAGAWFITGIDTFVSGGAAAF